MLEPRRKRLLQLLLFRSYSELRAESLSLRMGMLWWVLEPVLQMLIFYFVFAVLLERRTEYFVWFILIGQIAWRWLQMTVMQGARSIVQGQGLMQQVYVPKSFFPSVVLISTTCRFLATFALLLVFLWLFGFLPNMAYLALPLVLVVNFLFIAGAAYLVASILPFLPDMQMILNNGMRGLMFVSGIFFSGYELPEHLQPYFFMNPCAALLQAYRDILLDGRFPDIGHMLMVATVALVLVAVGKAVLKRFDDVYPRVVAQ